MKPKFIFLLLFVILFSCNRSNNKSNNNNKIEIDESQSLESKPFDRVGFFDSYISNLPILNLPIELNEESFDSLDLKSTRQDSIFLTTFLGRSKFNSNHVQTLYKIFENDSIVSTVFFDFPKFQLNSFNKKTKERISYTNFERQISIINNLTFLITVIDNEDRGNNEHKIETEENEFHLSKDGDFSLVSSKSKVHYSEALLRKLKPLFLAKIEELDTLSLPIKFEITSNGFGNLKIVSNFGGLAEGMSSNDSIFIVEFVDSYAFEEDLQGYIYEPKKIIETDKIVGLILPTEGSVGSDMLFSIFDKATLNKVDEIMVNYSDEDGNFITGEISDSLEVKLHKESIQSFDSIDDSVTVEITDVVYSLNENGSVEKKYSNVSTKKKPYN